jgi:hypothetical protein
VLNVAGDRKSKAAGIQEIVKVVVVRAHFEQM